MFHLNGQLKDSIDQYISGIYRKTLQRTCILLFEYSALEKNMMIVSDK